MINMKAFWIIVVVVIISSVFSILSDFGVKEEWFNSISNNFQNLWVGMLIIFLIYALDKDESKKADPYYKNEKEN